MAPLESSSSVTAPPNNAYVNFFIRILLFDLKESNGKDIIIYTLNDNKKID
jgi:hypothetical protein